MPVFLCPKEVDELDKLPPDERDLLERASGLQDFVRLNFGLFRPEADYKAIRAENFRRTQRAEQKALRE